LLDKMARTTTAAERREILSSLKAAVPKVVQLARAPFALNALARYWVLIDQPRAAVPFLRRALDRDPACAPCYETLAFARYQEEKFAEAVQAQERAIAAMGDRRPTPRMTRSLELYRAAAAAPAPP
jgi:predicted Zn-dependent protease